MPENNKTEEFLQKLAPCIERGELESCVGEAARVAGEKGIGAEELLGLSAAEGMKGRHDYAYALALAAVRGLEGKEKAVAYNNAGLAAQSLGKLKNSEEHYKLAIEANPKLAEAHSNYAVMLSELKRNEEAENHYKLAIEANPKLAEAHFNYAILLKEFKRNEEAENHYKLAIEANPKLAKTHYNYAILLKELKRNEEAENHYKLAIEANPKFAEAHSNYALMLSKLKRNEEAENHYKLAIEANPKYAAAHSNYAILLKELKRNEEAEEHYKLAIEANPKLAEAHYNYALMLSELKRNEEAENHYKLAIEANPKLAEAHFNYANLLSELKRNEEAEEHYKQAIAADPNLAEAHGAYGLLLIDLDKREEAWKETETASNIFKETGRITQSYLAKAWFYERYSEKNFDSKKFPQSGEDAGKAGEEYLRAAESSEGSLKDNLTLLGCEFKAKSFVRKIPTQSWYKKLLYKLGKNPNLPELIDNLKNAAIWYKKASLCPVDAKKDVCNACHVATSVFSDTLDAMGAFMNGEKATINKDDWQSSLDFARKIYAEKKKETGMTFIDTLKQLTECVNELAEHQVTGLKIQEDRLGKCYGNLIKVSENLDGALKLLTEHAAEAIKDYAKREGMGFVREEPKKSRFGSWLIKALYGALIAIALNIIANQLYDWNILAAIWNFMKSFFS